MGGEQKKNPPIFLGWTLVLNISMHGEESNSSPHQQYLQLYLFVNLLNSILLFYFISPLSVR